jgi:hypothetical protein
MADVRQCSGMSLEHAAEETHLFDSTEISNHDPFMLKFALAVSDRLAKRRTSRSEDGS